MNTSYHVEIKGLLRYFDQSKEKSYLPKITDRGRHFMAELTRMNLKEAFAGESKAYQMYSAYAEMAIIDLRSTDS